MRRRASFAGVALLLVAGVATRASAPAPDPLPSWRDGETKRAIVAFVERVSTPGNPSFVPAPERIAVFDNDGTLWQEHPIVEGAFALSRLRAMVERDPGLGEREPFRSALAGDQAALARQGPEAVLTLLEAAYAGVEDEALERAARRFLASARHPTLGARFDALTYQPMLELLRYLRAHGLTVWICSGGSEVFLRLVSHELYGVDPSRVIGTRFRRELVEREGRTEVERLPPIEFVNDHAGKPISIVERIGRRPIFAAGNERSGGDVDMLSWVDDRSGPSFQLLVDHDDAEREFSYDEPKPVSLETARRRGWTIVSMRRDWVRIFPPSVRTPDDRPAP